MKILKTRYYPKSTKKSVIKVRIVQMSDGKIKRLSNGKTFPKNKTLYKKRGDAEKALKRKLKKR